MRDFLRNTPYPLRFLVAIGLLAGCSGAQQSPAPGALRPPLSSQVPDLSTIGGHHIYVTNASYSVPSVTVYTRNAHGNPAPVQTISGPNTGLVQPMGVAVDAAGNIYVSDFFASDAKRQGGGSQQGVVFVYAAGSNGNAKPIATISDGLDYPYGVALDGQGNIYVGNFEGAGVTVYSTGSYKLIRTIGREGSYVGYVDGVAVDAAGNTYVVNTAYSGDRDVSDGGSVNVFAPGANGSDPPIQTIEGSRTGLAAPYGVAVAADGEIYVTNNAYHAPYAEILVFAAGANGNVKPIRVIRGVMTQLTGTGIALDAEGKIFVANDVASGSQSITEYRARAHGDAAPIRTISGPNTGLDRPSGIAVR